MTSRARLGHDHVEYDRAAALAFVLFWLADAPAWHAVIGHS
jgi:hypothetical protein